MEIVPVGHEYEIKCQYPLPSALKGLWTSRATAQSAIDVYQKGLQARIKKDTPAWRRRERKPASESVQEMQELEQAPEETPEVE